MERQGLGSNTIFLNMCVGCRGNETNKLFKQKAPCQGVSSSVWGTTVTKFSQEVMWSLLWFSLLLILTFLVLCPPHQNGISPAPLFRGLKPDRFVKRPWIESFGAVSQKSTCRAGVKRQLPIIPTRCQASFKGWRLKIKHIEASRLDHSQKIKHFELSSEGHSRTPSAFILNTI